jgi:hypothetical protein
VDGGEVGLICLPVCPGGGVRVLDWGRFFAGFWKVYCVRQGRGKKLAWLVGLKFKHKP